MQEQETEKKPPKLKLSSLRKVLGLLWRARSHPEAWEELIKHLEPLGTSEEDIAFMNEVYTARREARLDDKTLLRIDRYLVGGIGVIELILLQILLPMGTPDLWLSIARLSLVVSLPLVSGFLFFSFLKKEGEIATYGKIHSILSTLALLSGIVALAAAIFHVSLLDGIVFSCLALAIFILCSGYTVIFMFEKHSVSKFIELMKIATLRAITSTSDETKN